MGVGTPVENLDNKIERLKARMVEREERLRAMARRAHGACCPSCFHGRDYTSACDEQEADGIVLRTLLLARGTADDINLAEAIRVTAWP